MTVMFWPVVIFMVISLAVGLYTYTKVRGSSTRFAVCGKSLPFFVVGTALMAQAVDGNSTLGAASLTYTSSVWAGLMISIGLGLSLFVVGRYLADKPRDILYKLARSKNMWERRSAIVATAHFIMKQKNVDDTFAIAELLVNDKEDLVNKGTGWMLRAAGDVDRPRLLAFLDKHSATMPRVLLRYSIEKLDKEQREHYLGKKKGES